MRGIAIDAAEVASRQSYKHTWQPGKRAFTLETAINLMDDKRTGGLGGEGL
jgi:hypothetical protein